MLCFLVVAATVQQALYERNHPEPERTGPIKQILQNSDSLYKYINWEDPVRTLAVYLGATGVLFGAHHLPLTQLALKAGVTILGLVSVTEFASRSVSGSSLSARLRPKEYRRISEPTLNATLKDVHDFIQYAVDKGQRIIFGQDLDKTFATFLGFFALFWLTKLVTPFWFTFVVLTSIFVAPLASSERGRRAAHDASVRAQELANVAAEKGKELGHDGRVKAAELSSKGKQTAGNLSAQARDTASDMYGKASDLASQGRQTAGNISAQARVTASDLSGKASDLASQGGQTAANLSAQARGTASNMSGTAADNIKKVPQMGRNAVNETEDIASSTYGNAKGYVSNASAPSSDHAAHRDGSIRTNVVEQSDTEYQQYPVAYLDGQTGDARTGVATEHGAATHDMASRPRGVSQSTMDRYRD
ncbi:Reticulon-domain-containing protein [Massariosphaeria phaeospora]|uniref:Reticulon-domain-containing protein n=1 Tax=Massariosphaeria phaeospora TaxID=100035 RepID=A0A7C8I9U2_9PLEO|nr:Reticulon-domain-containing protein [Massariosphaeria phaeospora]